MVPGLRPVAGKAFHPCTLPGQQDHRASHRCQGHPPCSLQIRHFPLAGYNSSCFYGAGVRFFKRPADCLPAYGNLRLHPGFFFQQLQGPSGMTVRGGAAGNLYQLCLSAPICLAQGCCWVWADIIADDIVNTFIDIVLDKVWDSRRADCVGMCNLGMCQPTARSSSVNLIEYTLGLAIRVTAIVRYLNEKEIPTPIQSTTMVAGAGTAGQSSISWPIVPIQACLYREKKSGPSSQHMNPW